MFFIKNIIELRFDFLPFPYNRITFDNNIRSLFIVNKANGEVHLIIPAHYLLLWDELIRCFRVSDFLLNQVFRVVFFHDKSRVLVDEQLTFNS